MLALSENLSGTVILQKSTVSCPTGSTTTDPGG
jgi:hypothetical protein